MNTSATRASFPTGPKKSSSARVRRSLRHPPPPSTPDPRSTRLGYDLFHAQDKVSKTWSKKHSLFNEASRVLAAVMLVPDSVDKQRMENYITRVNEETLAKLRKANAEATYIPLTYARLKRKAPDWVRR